MLFLASAHAASITKAAINGTGGNPFFEGPRCCRSTYGGNPGACAAAIAVLHELRDRNLVEQCADRGRYLMRRLEDLRELGVVGEIRGKGLMVGIEFVADLTTMEPFPSEIGFGVRVGKNCVHKQKMLIRYAPNWVSVAPPFVISEAEIDEMVRRLRTSIIEVLTELRP